MSEGNASVCPRCGTTFTCGAGTGSCWCMGEEFRMPLPVEGDAVQGCYCPECLRIVAAERMAERGHSAS
ncbi:MAG: hypothetical protein C0606_13485 [Hyphomicrobiales bacterium]|nr:MAG: hypothetical protein C0606_13485 [Hyphomicrobiales bacterium]